MVKTMTKRMKAIALILFLGIEIVRCSQMFSMASKSESKNSLDIALLLGLGMGCDIVTRSS